MFHQPVFKKLTSAGLNSLQQKEYQISVKYWIFDEATEVVEALEVIEAAEVLRHGKSLLRT